MKTRKIFLALILVTMAISIWLPRASAKTLKIGIIESLNWPIGIDAINTIKLDIDKINKEGGLLIGGERYKIEVIIDDAKMDTALAKTAAEKQIYQDKVKFIKGDIFSVGYLDLANANKVVTLANPISPEIYNPEFRYIFYASPNTTTWAAMIPWAAHYLKDKKTILNVLPDRIDGRAFGVIWEKASKASGLKMLETLYYPPTAVDLSAVGTKIKKLNPDILVPFGGGPQADSLIIKAAYDAGYRGQTLDSATIPGETMIGIAGAQAIEGMIAIGWPAEFEPAITPLARQFKADWIAKYGKWTNPEVIDGTSWYILKAALQKASKPDPDEVKDILASGMEFDSIMGKGMMVSRPDYDNPRTVQSMFEGFIKQIEGGKVNYVATMSSEEAFEYCKKIFGW